MADRRWLVPLPALAVLALFAPVVGFDFVWDDGNLIVRNDALLRPDVWVEAWRQDFWALTANPGESGMYRPLVVLSYAAERRLWGLDAGPWHALNLLLQLACVGLVGSLARRLGASPLAAALGGLVYGLHPAQVVAVANVASRTDLLATAGVLLACRLSLATRAWPAAGLALLAALLSKESAVIGPLLVGLCVLGDPQPPTRRTARLAAPWVALAAYALLRVGLDLLPGGQGGGSFEGGWRVAAYAGRVLWPTAQPPYAQLATPGVALAVSTLLVPVGLAGLAAVPRAPRAVRLGLSWFLLALLPVAELVPLGARFSDLLLHLPLAGVALAIAGLADRLPDRVRPGLAALPLLLALLAAPRLGHWADNLRLWTWTLEHRPGHPEATLNLAVAQRAAGDREAGCATLALAAERAAEAGDTDTRVRATNNLGNCALEAGRPEEAARQFHAASEAAGGGFLPAEYGLSAALLAMGRADAALPRTTALVGRWPGDAGGWRVHGAALASTGRYAEAVAAFDRCLALSPDDAEARALRARAQRRLDEAGH